ncbi:SPOR domain-containing protein [Hydrogenophilus thermoluteolus]|uniref:SPOR domain-containing protein n=1 Tax=Hydrogenophilus thermoluteolus TaxID=297 RepID=UPI003F66B41D
MRFAIALLLVINALLFAAQSGLVSLPEPPRPQPLPQPLRSDALQLVAATVVEYTPDGAHTHRDAVAAAQSPITPPKRPPLLHDRKWLRAPPTRSLRHWPAQRRKPKQPHWWPLPHPPPAVITHDTIAQDKPQPSLEAVAPAQEPAAASAPQPPSTPTQPASPLPEHAAHETHPASNTVAPQPPTTPTVKTPVLLCRRTDATADERRILDELAQTVPGVQLTATAEPVVESWWVATPKAANEKRARQQAETLRQKGVTDLFIVRDPGPHQWRISLGIFRTRDRAENLVRLLRQKGVSEIEILPRTQSEHFTILAKGPEPALERFLGRAQARLPRHNWEACR